MIEVARALIVNKDRILCGRRPASMSLSGLWELPGGKFDPGETVFDCLMRETYEEFAIRVNPVQRLGTVERMQKGKLYRIAMWRCDWLSGEAIAREHDQMAWQPIARLYDLDWAPAEIKMLRAWRESLITGQKDFAIPHTA